MNVTVYYGLVWLVREDEGGHFINSPTSFLGQVVSGFHSVFATRGKEKGGALRRGVISGGRLRLGCMSNGNT